MRKQRRLKLLAQQLRRGVDQNRRLAFIDGRDRRSQSVVGQRMRPCRCRVGSTRRRRARRSCRAAHVRNDDRHRAVCSTGGAQEHRSPRKISYSRAGGGDPRSRRLVVQRSSRVGVLGIARSVAQPTAAVSLKQRGAARRPRGYRAPERARGGGRPVKRSGPRKQWHVHSVDELEAYRAGYPRESDGGDALDDADGMPRRQRL